MYNFIMYISLKQCTSWDKQNALKKIYNNHSVEMSTKKLKVFLDLSDMPLSTKTWAVPNWGVKRGEYELWKNEKNVTWMKVSNKSKQLEPLNERNDFFSSATSTPWTISNFRRPLKFYKLIVIIAPFQNWNFNLKKNVWSRKRKVFV